MKYFRFGMVFIFCCLPLRALAIDESCAWDLRRHFGARELRSIDPSIQNAVMDILQKVHRKPESVLGFEESELVGRFQLEKAVEEARAEGKRDRRAKRLQKARRMATVGTAVGVGGGFLAWYSTRAILERVDLEAILNFKYGLNLSGNSQNELRFLEKVLECTVPRARVDTLDRSYTSVTKGLQGSITGITTVRRLIPALLLSPDEWHEDAFDPLLLLWNRTGIGLCTPWGAATELRFKRSQIQALLEFSENQSSRVLSLLASQRGIVNTNISEKSGDMARAYYEQYTGKRADEVVDGVKQTNEQFEAKLRALPMGEMILRELDGIKKEAQGHLVVSKYVPRSRQLLLFHGSQHSHPEQVREALLRSLAAAVSEEHGGVGDTNVDWKSISFCRKRNGAWRARGDAWFPDFSSRLDPEKDFKSSFYCYNMRACSHEMQKQAPAKWAFLDELLHRETKAAVPAAKPILQPRCERDEESSVAEIQAAMGEIDAEIYGGKGKDKAGFDKLKFGKLMEALLKAKDHSLSRAEAEKILGEGDPEKGKVLLEEAVASGKIALRGDKIEFSPELRARLEAIPGFSDSLELYSKRSNPLLLAKHLKDLAQKKGRVFGNEEGREIPKLEGMSPIAVKAMIDKMVRVDMTPPAAGEDLGRWFETRRLQQMRNWEIVFAGTNVGWKDRKVILWALKEYVNTFTYKPLLDQGLIRMEAPSATPKLKALLEIWAQLSYGKLASQKSADELELATLDVPSGPRASFLDGHCFDPLSQILLHRTRDPAKKGLSRNAMDEIYSSDCRAILGITGLRAKDGRNPVLETTSPDRVNLTSKTVLTESGDAAAAALAKESALVWIELLKEK